MTNLAAVLILSVLPVINDNYAIARSRAIERKAPVFVEVWAPW